MVEKKDEITPEERANTMKWAYVQDFSGLKNGSPSEYADLQTNQMTK